MNRKWMVAGGLAAAVALALGVFLGRQVISEEKPALVPKKQAVAPKFTRFADPVTGLSMSYPAGWTRLPASVDQQVRLRVAADASTSLSLRVANSGLAPVTVRSLPIVKQYTDTLLGADARTRQLSPATPVQLGGLPGWRYRYVYGSADGSSGAHIHYFLFASGRLIQLVFQALPANRLSALEPTFDRLAGTFRSGE